MPKIYTRKGDGGQAMSPDGMKSKDDIIFDLFGTIDEAQAHIGMLFELLREEIQDENAYNFNKRNFILQQYYPLRVIMSMFYEISGSIFTKRDLSVPDFPDFEKRLEEWIDEMDKELEPLDHFILPIGSKASAQAHIARAVVRRLERLFIHWDQLNEYKTTRVFLNRLSDYLFTLARILAK